MTACVAMFWTAQPFIMRGLLWGVCLVFNRSSLRPTDSFPETAIWNPKEGAATVLKPTDLFYILQCLYYLPLLVFVTLLCRLG